MPKVYTSKEQHKGFNTFYPKSIEALRSWLSEFGETEKSVWIILNKKNSPDFTFKIGTLIDHALCFGWVDSKSNTRDEFSYYVYIAKRNPKSNWSAINKKKIEQLINDGLLEKPGYEMVALAKETGTWDALNDVDNLIKPMDLKDAFKNNSKAELNFNAFSKSVQRGILEWLFNAKREETRKKRIEKIVSMAEDNLRAIYDK